MSSLEFMQLWNAKWKNDYWWRQKHNVAFNSEAHRAMDPIDIHLEYVEHQLAQQQIEKMVRAEKNADRINKGEWIEENKERSAVSKVWDKMDLKQFV